MPPPEALDPVGRIKLCPLCWKPRWSARPLETPICQCGAKSKMTPEIVNRLTDAFSAGANISQACFYADISRETYYTWIREYPELKDRFEALRERIPLAAKQNINRAIHAGSVPDSWRFLEKRDPDYKEKLQVEHTGLESPAAAASPAEAAAWQEYLQKRRADRQRRALENDKEYQELKKQQDEQRPATGEVAGEVGRPQQASDSGGSNTAGS